MKKILALIFVCFSISVARADFKQMPEGIYKADPAHTSVIFKVSHLGLSYYTARFTDVDASINYKPKNPQNSAIEVSIDPNSISTSYPNPEKEDFDKKLSTEEDWFNSVKYPEIKFKSEKIEIDESNKTAKIIGNLTLLGQTKPIMLDVKLNGNIQKAPFSGKPTFGFSGITRFKRSEWGFDTYIPQIGDEVGVIIEAEFVKE